MSVEIIGVVGAGQMGNGIAQVFASKGFQVRLMDMSEDALQKALQVIEKSLLRLVSKGKLDAEEVPATIGRIRTGSTLNVLADTDLVIEAATENQDVKQAIFRDICKVVRKDTVLASNTSSISITRLASATDRPDKFIGMHFMNPVPVMRLVEIIRGIATSDETHGLIEDLVQKLGKESSVSEDFPAFIVNRILIPMINEAIYSLHEGVGSIEDIDKGMRLGANHPMGPLELADFIGLDTCLAIMNVLHEGLADTKYRPCPLLVKYVEAGWLGRKSGRGFYDYSGDAPVATR